MSDSVMCQVDPLTFWTQRGEPRALFQPGWAWLCGCKESASCGAVANLKGVIEQLLHLLSKHLLMTRHLAGCGQAWSLATQNLVLGVQTTQENDMITHVIMLIAYS